MTLKSYLRMLLAAVTLLFVTSGCNDDDDKVGPPPSYSFSVAVSDVAQTQATVTVTPSNDQATDYYAAGKKAEFDTFESDAAYAQHILDNLKAIADKKVLPLSEYLATALVKGSAPQKITDLTAGTDYYAVALGMLTDGRFTSDLVKEAFKTDDAPEPAPELTLSMRAGDASGANTSSYVTCHIKSSDIVSAKAAFLMKSAVDKALAEGKTLAEILAGVTTDPTLKTEQVEKINSADGYDLPCRGVPAATAVTAIVSVTSANGKTTVDSASATTDAAQGGDLTFTIAVTNIGAKGADINITPSNNSDTYYFDIYPASVVDQIPDDNQLIAAIIGANDGDVTKYLSTGPDGYSKELIEQYIPFDPETEYCVVAFGCNGTAGTTAVTKERFTTLADDGETGDGPELTLTLRAGDANGANTDTKVYMGAYAPTATGAYYGVFLTSDVEKVLAQGASYDAIVTQNGTDMSTKDGWLDGLVQNPGIGVTFSGLDPATSYTCILKVTDSAGKSTTKHVAATTEGGGEASDAYKAWLGTWTLTSTSSEVNAAPLSFDVTFIQGVANSSYKLQGWGITTIRDQSQILPSAKFDSATGNFEILEGQSLYTDPEDGSVLTLTGRALLQGKYYIINGGYPGFTGKLNADKNSATITLYQGSVEGMGNFTTSSMDFFWVLGQDIYWQKAAEGYTDKDYPIGPYTMTRKSSGASVAASKSAATILHASKLSSVLSGCTVLSTSVKQNGVVFESQVAMPSSLVFDRPAASGTVIGNSGKFENAGLKKQISNNLDNNTDFQLLNRL